MKRRSRALIAAASLMCALGLGLGVWAATRTNVEAADHLDPPMRVNPDPAQAGDDADRAADIADVFAWHRGTGDDQMIVLAMTYSGPNPAAADQTAHYDADVIYQFHIDTDSGDTGGDAGAEHTINVRFGQSPSGNWGIQVEGVPGEEAAAVAGPVETVNRLPGVVDGLFFVGLVDDPFYFDLVGFRETAAMGTLRFCPLVTGCAPPRDFFADQNSSAIVIEFRAADIVRGPDNSINVWATTGRDNT
jgi:hypothetical protein